MKVKEDVIVKEIEIVEKRKEDVKVLKEVSICDYSISPDFFEDQD